jgi:hypothetical protein
MPTASFGAAALGLFSLAPSDANDVVAGSTHSIVNVGLLSAVGTAALFPSLFPSTARLLSASFTASFVGSRFLGFVLRLLASSSSFGRPSAFRRRSSPHDRDPTGRATVFLNATQLRCHFTGMQMSVATDTRSCDAAR